MFKLYQSLPMLMAGLILAGPLAIAGQARTGSREGHSSGHRTAAHRASAKPAAHRAAPKGNGKSPAKRQGASSSRGHPASRTGAAAKSRPPGAGRHGDPHKGGLVRGSGKKAPAAVLPIRDPRKQNPRAVGRNGKPGTKDFGARVQGPRHERHHPKHHHKGKDCSGGECESGGASGCAEGSNGACGSDQGSVESAQAPQPVATYVYVVYYNDGNEWHYYSQYFDQDDADRAQAYLQNQGYLTRCSQTFWRNGRD